MKVFVFDSTLCNGCYNCQLACKDEHTSKSWLPYAKQQPELGHFWMKLKEVTHGQTPKVRVEYTPVLCQHCDDAPCMKASDAFYRTKDGLVILDPKKAGDKNLLDLCPYGTIYWNDELSIAQKCTGCAHLVAAGKEPHCVEVCVQRALRFGEEEDFAEEIAAAESLKRHISTKSRVHYLNLPHLFIAGDVWDPTINDVIEGAKVTLYDAEGTVLAETETDDFGDFWFNKLIKASYKVKVEAEGYKAIEKESGELAQSLNMGDFPLEKL